MPFTGSHAAAVLPLLWVRWGGRTLPASALVLGSMAPDVPYYLALPDGLDADLTHSFAGTLGVDVGLAFGLWLGWHGLLAAPALAGAPRAVHSRWGDIQLGLRARMRPENLLALYVAFALGAMTHAGWDSFTHAGRWGPQHIEALNDEVAGQPLWRWAQYASGVVGLLAIAAYVMWLWRRTPPGEVPPSQGAVVGWLAVATAGFVGAVIGAIEHAQAGTGHGLHFMIATRGISATAAGAVVVCLIWHLRHRA